MAPARTAKKTRSKRSKPLTKARRRPLRKNENGVVLLSGGNPQIPKGDGAAPVQMYIANMPGWKSAVGKQLDQAIARAVPRLNKAVKWNSPFYGVEGQGWFLAIHVFTHFVRVTFFRGTQLDPQPPGPSKDPNTRYYDIREGAFDARQFTRWVKQAAAIPGWLA